MNKVLITLSPVPGRSVAVVLGDITKETTDAIVNPANTRLRHGGGVAGAIVRAGGAAIQVESLELAPVPTGSAAVTTGGDLPCRYVVHAVGPVWGGGAFNEVELLRLAVNRCLMIAQERRWRSISVATISAGVFGFPRELAVETIVETAMAFFRRFPETPLLELRFCEIRDEICALFVKQLQRY